MTTLNETDVESAALDWLAATGWQVAHGPDIAPDTLGSERHNYGQMVLDRRLRDALTLLNPSLPTSALDEAVRKLTQPEGATLEARNRAFHRMLVNGVTVEYRTSDGSIRGESAQVVDFDNPDNNDWLAVNQFTVTENQNTRRPDIVLFLNGLPLGVIERIQKKISVLTWILVGLTVVLLTYRLSSPAIQSWGQSVITTLTEWWQS